MLDLAPTPPHCWVAHTAPCAGGLPKPIRVDMLGPGHARLSFLQPGDVLRVCAGPAPLGCDATMRPEVAGAACAGSDDGGGHEIFIKFLVRRQPARARERRLPGASGA